MLSNLLKITQLGSEWQNWDLKPSMFDSEDGAVNHSAVRSEFRTVVSLVGD